MQVRIVQIRVVGATYLLIRSQTPYRWAKGPILNGISTNAFHNQPRQMDHWILENSAKAE